MAKCKYCECGEDNEAVFADREACGKRLSAFTIGRIDGNTLSVGMFFGDTFCEAKLGGFSRKIKYCPMCGRKLQKGEQNG